MIVFEVLTIADWEPYATQPHPKSAQVVWTRMWHSCSPPAMGSGALLARERAVPQVVLDVRCPHEGRMWLLELVADEAVEGGLRPVWRDPRIVATGQTIEGPGLVELGRLRCWTPCHGHVVSMDAATVTPGLPVPLLCRCRALWIVEFSALLPDGGRVAMWRCGGPDPRIQRGG